MYQALFYRAWGRGYARLRIDTGNTRTCRRPSTGTEREEFMCNVWIYATHVTSTCQRLHVMPKITNHIVCTTTVSPVLSWHCLTDARHPVFNELLPLLCPSLNPIQGYLGVGVTVADGISQWQLSSECIPCSHNNSC